MERDWKRIRAEHDDWSAKAKDRASTEGRREFARDMLAAHRLDHYAAALDEIDRLKQIIEDSAEPDVSPTRIVVASTDTFDYAMVYDTRDHSREHFRGARNGDGARPLRHVDRDALPEEVAHAFLDVLVADSERQGDAP